MNLIMRVLEDQRTLNSTPHGVLSSWKIQSLVVNVRFQMRNDSFLAVTLFLLFSATVRGDFIKKALLHLWVTRSYVTLTYLFKKLFPSFLMNAFTELQKVAGLFFHQF